MTYTKGLAEIKELPCSKGGTMKFLIVDGTGIAVMCNKVGGAKVEEANARRLAALWNAAEELELTTEKIAEGEIQAIFFRNQERSKLIGVALERIEKIEAEKAEMLRALEAVTGDSEESDYMTQAQIQRLCRAAIKKARGEE